MQEWDDVLERLADVKADPINPRRVFVELNRRLPSGAIITCDAGIAKLPWL